MNLEVPHYLQGLSALARYYGKSLPGYSFELIEGSIVDLAKCFDDISYPGVDGIEAVVVDDGLEAVFSCADDAKELPRQPFAVMNLLFDKGRGVFVDRSNCYAQLRSRELGLAGSGCSGAVHAAGPAPEPNQKLDLLNLLQAAALVSCFGFKPDPELLAAFKELAAGLAAAPPAACELPAPLLQRLYLTAVISGESPIEGLSLLRDYGAVELLWPELHALVGLDQAKEFHPEGDVWEHSLETLSHRKTNDPELSFALLLHDIGKPLSQSADGNRFNNHAQIGANAAVAFLRRLEFSEDKIKKIRFLVENHMLPAAIKSLPTFRTEKAMSNPYFPLLLEVYRCDLMSSFNGPEGYYDACKVYRSFVKNTKNPFRGSDGKKLYRLYVD